MTTSYLSPKLEVRAAPHKGGFAVFARETLEKDELVCIWTGKIASHEQMMALSDDERSHTIQVDEELYLIPSSMEEPADYINHSCAPNTGMRGQVALVAMRAIAVGEEVTFDYAMADSTPYDEFPCSCGAATCRGHISGDDWQRPALWECYDGYFSPYLQKKINERKNNV